MGTHRTRRVVTITGPGSVVVRDETMHLPDQHVLVRVKYCGLCGSDRGDVHSVPAGTERPLGHEVVGVVEESRCASIHPGSRVVALCADGMADAVTVSADKIYPIPDGLAFTAAVLAEPLACVIGGTDVLTPPDGDRIIVVGAGFMGALTIRLLSLRGYEVIAVARDLAKRSRALNLGAASAYAPDSDELLRLRASLVLECAGTQSALDLASQLVPSEGVLSIQGYHQSNQGNRQVPMAQWNFQALTVTNAHVPSARRLHFAVRRALRLLAAGHMPTQILITAEINLDAAAQLLSASPQRRGKYLVVPDGA